jgi:Tol biopolymer transport system component
MKRGMVVLLAACGSDPVVPDAMPDAAPRCDPSMPFASVVPVDGLNTSLDDLSARLSPDELTVVFSRQTGGFYDLFQATRTSRDVAFTGVELMATVNSINSELWPTMSPDGLLLMFDSDRGTGMQRIHVSTRATTADRFTAAQPAPALEVGDRNPYLANGRALYFGSATRAGIGMSDLWRVEVDSTGATSTPVAVVGGVNTAEAEVTATLTEDELRIYFRRTVGAELDIFTATRSTISDGFGASTAVPVAAMPGVNEVPNWISADGCNLYFHSDAQGGMGGLDLYVARRGSP